MELIIGKNTKVAVQKTLAVAIAISAITLATEGVVTTSAAHSLANGDWVRIKVTAGMVELDGQVTRIKAAAGSALTLEGVDTTGFSSQVGGTAELQAITAWENFDNVKMFDLPEADPDRLDSSVVHGYRKTTVFGQDGELTGSVTLHSNPSQAAVALVRAATKSQSAMAFRIITGGNKTVAANAEWSGGRGFSIQTGQISESKISLTIKGETVYYAT